jgi:hypothetical protein
MFTSYQKIMVPLVGINNPNLPRLLGSNVASERSLITRRSLLWRRVQGKTTGGMESSKDGIECFIACPKRMNI